MKSSLKVKFPCGYNFEESHKMWDIFTLGYFKIDAKDLPLCPLHGIKCK